VAKLKLKINFWKGAEITEQPLRTKPGIPFSSADFVDRNCLKALQTSSIFKARVKYCTIPEEELL
jgi:hypothetical protein